MRILNQVLHGNSHFQDSPKFSNDLQKLIPLFERVRIQFPTSQIARRPRIPQASVNTLMRCGVTPKYPLWSVKIQIVVSFNIRLHVISLCGQLDPHASQSTPIVIPFHLHAFPVVLLQGGAD